MPLIVKNKVVYISVNEIINYLNGITMDMEKDKDFFLKEVEKLSNPQIKPILAKITNDDFNMFISKLSFMTTDLKKHLDFSFVKESKKSEQRKINNKCECMICHKQYKSKSSLIQLVDLDMIYKRYCDECLKLKLVTLSEQGIFGLDKEKLKDADHQELNDLAKYLDIAIQNYVLSRPELMEKIYESEPYKNLMKEFNGK